MQALAQNVTVIPARRRVGSQKTAAQVQKVRVAAYCRVSTDSEEQETSYEAQVSHYTEYIKSKPEWQMVEVYADDGISGTNTVKRDEFNRMIADCEAGKIDLILTKSISRFSRNTLDCLKYTRKLKALKIAVFFEKENINTMDSKGEVLLTIMASLAQQESESLSANVRMGIQYRNQQGKVQINHNWFLGYTKDAEGNLVIDPEQAEIVRRIYREYLEGASFLQIKRSLEADGILNGAGHLKWHESNIHQILTNEKYIGDALLQKTYTVSILEKKRSANNGQMPKYYVEGSHEAIIDKDVFMRVQSEIARRANLNPDGKRRVYSSRYALSGMVYCGHCGDIYRRVKWNNRGCKSTVWRCVSRVLKKQVDFDCPARTVKEEVLQGAILTAVNDAYARKDIVTALLRQNIESTVFEDLEARMAAVDEKLADLQTQMIAVSGDEVAIEALGDQIDTLREERQTILTEAAERSDLKERMNDMISFLDEMPQAITEYSDAITRRLVEKVTIFDEKILVVLKSGLQMEVEA
ncbi:recombinase family protein [Ruminococcus bromii]|nr:recombinase family protein [Ruminococcus bromii]RGI76364.1 recombinase family protein [Ruminococcus bromii]RGI80556.1 recombinase family protein [Ruminococcus bromii]